MTDEHSVTLATPTGLVTLAWRGDLPRRLRRRSDEHRRFLSGHWAELKAAAWGGYREHGAGAVVLWRDRAPRRWAPRPFEPERLWYTTQVHVLPGATEADFSGWEAQQIETYDPEQEALVVFVEGTAFTGYRVCGSISPAQARQRAETGLN